MSGGSSAGGFFPGVVASGSAGPDSLLKESRFTISLGAGLGVSGGGLGLGAGSAPTLVTGEGVRMVWEGLGGIIAVIP